MYSTRADRGREGGRERERGRGKRAIAGGPRAYAKRGAWLVHLDLPHRQIAHGDTPTPRPTRQRWPRAARVSHMRWVALAYSSWVLLTYFLFTI